MKRCPGQMGMKDAMSSTEITVCAVMLLHQDKDHQHDVSALAFDDNAVLQEL